ncbi:MAG TPA: hypothetical protein PKV17_06955 [Aquabacterium sp.]|nr:hypothetical protein [Aquabacterium sp.]HRH28500.1 hypothetical protein [Aquabacterium sp.]
MHPATASAILARLMSTLTCCVLAAGQGVAAPVQAAPSLNDPTAASLWPRIFYTPEQRTSIENFRKPEAAAAVVGTMAPAVVAPPLTYRLEGVAQGRGSATAWINGQTLRQGQDIEGRTVHIGDGVVRLHQAGRPDIVLRPGQQAGEAGTTPQDVVPSGAVRQRPGR